MATLAMKKDARLDLKTTVQNKELLAQAALLRGVDMTTFIMAPALEAAREVVALNEKMQLEKQEQQALFEALAKPSAPSDELKELLAAGTFSER
ncbi:DUF1778 domain-containing protein [Catenovulum agarivorans]|uniref:type II toxin-antitoxin system TacA family antitoxin n=1 Tax=Catenovulum agarivorans TaxID=1172192 RepID=UPI0002DE421C|nr:DUF1778 domain-containing protein [Catenovulum agarivorans]